MHMINDKGEAVYYFVRKNNKDYWVVQGTGGTPAAAPRTPILICSPLAARPRRPGLCCPTASRQRW